MLLIVKTILYILGLLKIYIFFVERIVREIPACKGVKNCGPIGCLV